MYITANVPISDMGSARLGIAVADTLRRNRKITRITSTSVSMSVIFTSCTESRMPCARSKKIVASTAAGICARSEGRSALMASATSTVLVPGCFWTASEMERSPLSHCAVRLFWMSSSTRPISRRRTGAPSRYVTTRSPNCAAVASWPLVWTVNALLLPQSTPLGMFGFAASMAAATSSMPMPRLASCRGSTCTRAAYFAEPPTFTAATPLTVEMRCAITVSAYSSSCDSGIVAECRLR